MPTEQNIKDAAAAAAHRMDVAVWVLSPGGVLSVEDAEIMEGEGYSIGDTSARGFYFLDTYAEDVDVDAAEQQLREALTRAGYN